MNYNGTKVVWKDAIGEGLDKEMEGVPPLMLAILFVSTDDLQDMVNSLISTDEEIGNHDMTK